MSNRNKKKLYSISKTPISPWVGVSLTLFLVICFSVLLSIKFLYYQDGRTPLVDDLLHPTLSAGTCPYHDFLSREDYLRTYIVKSGDTLVSIAKEQLGDSSRLNELLHLNHDTYPGLSVEKPFLEVGWKLFLPTTQIPRSSGNLFYIRGRVIDIQKDTWIIATDPNPMTFPTYVTNMRKGEYKGKAYTDYKKGDCVMVLYDWDASIQAPLFVKPQ